MEELDRLKPGGPSNRIGRTFHEMYALGEGLARELHKLLDAKQLNVLTIPKEDLCRMAGTRRFMVPHARELTGACRRYGIVVGFGERVAVFSRDENFAGL